MHLKLVSQNLECVNLNCLTLYTQPIPLPSSHTHISLPYQLACADHAE